MNGMEQPIADLGESVMMRLLQVDDVLCVRDCSSDSHAFMLPPCRIYIFHQCCAGSEDKTMKIWSFAGICLQTIRFAGCVWSLTFLPSEDVVAGVSDSNAYVFSSDEVRQGPSSMQAAFEAAVVAHEAENAPSKGTGSSRSSWLKVYAIEQIFVFLHGLTLSLLQRVFLKIRLSHPVHS